MYLAEVAPAAPVAVGSATVLAITGGLILVAFGWIILKGIDQAYEYTFGAFLDSLTLGTSIFGIHLSVPGAGALNKLIRGAIGDGLTALEWSAGRLFYALGYTIRTTAYATQVLAQATYDGIKMMTHAVIPNAITNVYKTTVVRPVKDLNALRAQVFRLSRYAHAHVGALERELDRDFGRAWEGIDNLRGKANKGAAALAAGIAAKFGYTAKQIARMNRRLTTLEKEIGAGVAASAVAVALGKLGVGWIRCKNWKRIGREVCHMDARLISAFIATTTEALVVLDLCRYALAAQKLAKVVVLQLGPVLLVQNAVCLGGGASLPTAHDSPPLRTKITLPTAHD